MDLFAAILITITAVTICGICLFIFVCAFQPRVLRKLHGKTSRAFLETDSNGTSNKNEDNLSVQSLDLVIGSTDPTTGSFSTSVPTNDREKKAFLKALEQSLRSGRRIEANDQDNANSSGTNPFNFIRHFINKYIRRRTSETHNATDL